jgi:hypothetical protein
MFTQDKTKKNQLQIILEELWTQNKEMCQQNSLIDNNIILIHVIFQIFI